MDTLDVWYHQFDATAMLDLADSTKERKEELAVMEKARCRIRAA
jgi:hypothetical protein